MALVAQGGVVLRGNHEELALTPPAVIERLGEMAADWTHRQLSTRQRAWLAALPLVCQQDLVLLVHASANAPERWRYVDSPMVAADSLDTARAWPAVRYVFGCHVHAQTLYYHGAVGKLMPVVPQAGVAIPVSRDQHWVATVGSVGQPRDGNPQPMHALLDCAAEEITFYRVHYDHAAAADAIRRMGLPDYFARGLERRR